MKNLVLKTASLIALFAAGTGFSQITTTAEGTYLIGDFVEVGIDKHAHEGTHEEPGVTTHVRTTYWGTDSRFGFVAIPEELAVWGTNFDGDFFTPGSPENGFGITYMGTNYTNNSTFTGTATGAITSTLAGTVMDDECMTATYDLTVGATGIQMEMSYNLVETNLYYTTEVTITNTTGATMNNIYFGRNVDPDNNVSMAGGTYVTTNTVVAQPSASCDKAIVTATSNAPASNPSFMGFGAIGPEFRVGHGGFGNDDAEDMWTGVTASTWDTFYTTEGDVNTGDQAIWLSYRVATLAPGASETFKFVVILADTQVEAALADLFTFDSPALITSSDECTPTEDTVETCPNVPVEISFDGPIAIDYDWVWSPPTGLSTTTGLTTNAAPSTTTTYTITGTPVNPCYTEPIERTIVVDMLPGPIIDVTDPGMQCSDFLLSDLVITDVSGLGGTIITEFYTVEPDSIDDPDDMWPTTFIAPYEEPIVMMGNLDNGCFATDTISLDWGGVSQAGDDSTESVCNVAGTIVNLDTYRSTDSEPGGTWEDASAAPAPGSFTTATGVFDASGVPAGTYEFYYIVDGTGVCPDDTAIFTVDVSQEVIAGADNVSEHCNTGGTSVDINTLLSGADAGGFFEETTFSGQFTPATGVLDLSGLAGSVYSFDYIMLGVAPCPNDTATFNVTVNENPVISAGFDQVLCEEAASTAVFGAGAGTGGSYAWDMGVTNGTSFTPPVGVSTYNVVGTDANGCIGSDNMSITVNPTPIIDIIPDTTLGCTDFRVLFTETSTPASMDCFWTFGDGSTSDDCGTVMNVYENAGDYTVSLNVTSIDGCVNSIAYTDLIHVEAQPVASFQFSPNVLFAGDTDTEFDNGSLNADTYSWDFGDGSNSNEENPEHTFPIDASGITYNVELVAANNIGCADTVYQQITVQDIILFYIPNTFTPDGDQFNETFSPVFTEGIDIYDFHMVVFNRWGEIVFESYNPDFQWNGNYGNQGLVNEGVYVWQLEFKETMSDKRHKHNGHVTVLK